MESTIVVGKLVLFQMAELAFKTGEVIISEGEMGTSAYLLKSGSVEVSRKIDGSRVVLAILEAGQIFGEMSLIDESPRSATVTALKTCVVEEITRELASNAIRGSPPLLQYLLVLMVDRMRGMNEQILASRIDLGQPPISNVHLSGASKAATDVLGTSPVNLNRFPYRVGRRTSKANLFSLWKKDLLIKDNPPYNVSRNHFVITRCHEDIFVVDEGSTVGTIVNGTRIGGPTSMLRVRCEEQENLIIVGSETSPYHFQLRIDRAG